MKIVKLKGGLGNQMFQYSFACLLKDYTDEEIKLDLTDYNILIGDTVRRPRILEFDCSLQEASLEEIERLCLFKVKSKPMTYSYKLKTLAEAAFNPRYYLEKTRERVDVSGIICHDYFNGYWQNINYVNFCTRIKTDFTPKNGVSEKTQKAITDVTNCESVFIGVRRGDYLAEKKHYGVFDSSYYEKAIQMVCNRVDHPVFFVFSNDISWAKDNINWGTNDVVFRTPEMQTSDFEELQIMRNCNNAIIINSTFHWWGAYLINNPNKIIIRPESWFADKSKIDLFAPSWICCK